MGRHGTPRSRPMPWDVIGWCAFAGVVAAVSLLLLGESWVTALLVLGAGAVAIAVIVWLAAAGPRSGASSGHGRDHP
jgi:hypothetical protein